jgi:hypothetical protein
MTDGRIGWARVLEGRPPAGLSGSPSEAAARTLRAVHAVMSAKRSRSDGFPVSAQASVIGLLSWRPGTVNVWTTEHGTPSSAELVSIVSASSMATIHSEGEL